MAAGIARVVRAIESVDLMTPRCFQTARLVLTRSLGVAERVGQIQFRARFFPPWLQSR